MHLVGGYENKNVFLSLGTGFTKTRSVLAGLGALTLQTYRVLSCWAPEAPPLALAARPRRGTKLESGNLAHVRAQKKHTTDHLDCFPTAAAEGRPLMIERIWIF